MSEKRNTKKANYREPLFLLASVIFGGVLGMILGEKASVIKPIGQSAVLSGCSAGLFLHFKLHCIGWRCKTGGKTAGRNHGRFCCYGNDRRNNHDDTYTDLAVCNRNCPGKQQ